MELDHGIGSWGNYGGQEMSVMPEVFSKAAHYHLLPAAIIIVERVRAWDMVGSVLES